MQCYFMLLLIQCVYVTIQGSEATERSLVKARQGKIESTSYNECKAVPKKTWDFPAVENAHLCLIIEELRIERCDFVRLRVTSAEKTWSYCDLTLPAYTMYSSAVTVNFHMDARFCTDRFRISFVYIEPWIKVNSETPAIVGQKVKFTMVLSRFPGSIPLPMCRVYYGNGKQSELVRDRRYVTETTFYFPGKYNYKSNCRLGEQVFQASRDLYVEANLQRPPLGLYFSKTEAAYLSNAELTFSHTYSFPIYYHLTIKDISFTRQLTSFESDLFTQKSLTSQSFVLTREQQEHLGPGKHSFVMVLANNVSSLIISDVFYLIEAITRLQVAVASYVGNHPYPTTINVTTARGAPISLILNILELPMNKSVVKLNSVCSNRCPLLQLRTTLPQSNTRYMIEAIANNQAPTAVAAHAIFTATPFVYDVYVTSARTFVVGQDNKMLFFFRGNMGKYKMSVVVDKQKWTDHRFEITRSAHTPSPKINFPMDSRDYAMISKSIVFESSGEKVVRVTVQSALVSQRFEQSVLVQYEEDCDVRVRIRDGNNKNWLETALRFDRRLHLTTDSVCRCTAAVIPSYKWEIFRIESSDETPTSKHRLELNQKAIDPSLHLDMWAFPPGLYVAKLSLTAYDQGHWQAIGYHQDFTLVRVGRKSPDVVIEGGSRREVGLWNELLKFRALLPRNNTYVINWFCSTKHKELPRDASVGKVTRKSSCFGWKQPMWFSHSTEVEVPLSDFVKVPSWFIRAIVSFPGLDPVFADQQIDFVRDNIPKMYLRCMSNCKGDLYPHLSVVLSLDCDQCTKIDWKLVNSDVDALRWCTNNRRCRIDTNIIRELNPAKTNHLVVKGIDSRERSAAVEFYIKLRDVPTNGKCVTTPLRIAHESSFQIECFEFTSSRHPLTYSFYLDDEDKSYPLLLHGYDRTLSDVTIPVEESSTVRFRVEVCDLDGSCSYESVTIRVAPRLFERNLTSEFGVAIRSRNLQRILQLLIFNRQHDVIEQLVDQIIDMVFEMKLFSIESAKQICDVLNYVTALDIEMINKMRLQQKLVFIKDFMTKQAFDYDLTFFARSCVSSTNNLIKSHEVKYFLFQKSPDDVTVPKLPAEV